MKCAQQTCRRLAKPSRKLCEQCLEIRRRWHAKHHDERVAKQKEYYWNNRDMFRVSKKKYYLKNRERLTRNNVLASLKRKYGLAADEYAAMLKKQKGKCAICQQVPTKRALSVDHDHSSGQVRGLLCGVCNMVVGYLEDSVEKTRRVTAYLQKHAQLKLVIGGLR